MKLVRSLEEKEVYISNSLMIIKSAVFALCMI
nr:MAG TPA: Multidrug efflux pump-associated protein AcrZ [Caudoviricetes sp.]